jgi:hypothetical protein
MVYWFSSSSCVFEACWAVEFRGKDGSIFIQIQIGLESVEMTCKFLFNSGRSKGEKNSSFLGAVNPSQNQNFQRIRLKSYLPENECEKNQIHIV